MIYAHNIHTNQLHFCAAYAVAAAAVAYNRTNRPADIPCLRSAFQFGLFHGQASVLLLPPLLLLLLLLLAMITRQRWVALLPLQL
jgi:hypothetical protein